MSGCFLTAVLFFHIKHLVYDSSEKVNFKKELTKYFLMKSCNKIE